MPALTNSSIHLGSARKIYFLCSGERTEVTGHSRLLTACQHPSEECLSIAFTGDVLLDRGVRQQIQRGGVEDLFASVAPLFHQMDATVINLECPVNPLRP